MKRLLWIAAPAAMFIACADGSWRTTTPDETNTPASDPALDEGDVATDPVGNGAAGARKGAGGQNGDGDFCDNGTCVATEGDCDSSAQCGGAACLTDNGGRYADLTGARANQQDDHCAPATCNNFVQDPGEAGVDCGGPCGLCAPVCELPQHHAARCTYHCQCAGGSGDCDSNRDCQGWDNPNAALAAVCGADLGARFGGPGTNDYCVQAHCLNRVQDEDETGIDSGGSCGPANCAQQRLVAGSECTPSCPCPANAGDCDSNLDCDAGLVCVERGVTDRCEPPAGGVFTQFSGPQTNVDMASLQGWSVCYLEVYNGGSGFCDAAPVTNVQTMLGTACTGANLMLACRQTGSNILRVAAHAPRADVLTVSGRHTANGSDWYFGNVDGTFGSWGFVPQGAPISRNTCNTSVSSNTLCWHTHTPTNNFAPGWDCGGSTSLQCGSGLGFERVILQAN